MIIQSYKENLEDELEGTDPHTKGEIEEMDKETACVLGPVSYSDHPLGEIVSGQGDLERGMRRELDRLTNRMYR